MTDWQQIEGSNDPLFGFNKFATMDHRTQENLLTQYIINLLQRILKGMYQQPNEEIHRVISEAKELLFLWSLGQNTMACGSVLVSQQGSSPI